MSQADMQRMMQQMQQAQVCMQGIDPSRMEALQQRTEQMESDIRMLCKQGKRDEAQSKGMEFAREVTTDPDMKQIQKCGQMMRGAMPTMPFMNAPDSTGGSSGHVCDEMK